MNFIEKAEKLDPKLRRFFSSNEIVIELEKSCFLYGVPEENIPFISGPIGLIFAGDIKLENLPNIIWEKLRLEKGFVYGLSFEINKRIFNIFPEYFRDSSVLFDQWSKMKSNPVISEDEAWKKVLEIEPWILEGEEKDKKTASTTPAYKQTSKQLPITEALKAYPDIFEQIVTEEKVKIGGNPEPVRGSVKNWLSDYTAKLGYIHHDSVQRGNYLFQSENARSLGYSDRQKLSQILKSFDEKSPLSIDTENKKIIFEERREAPKPSPKTPEKIVGDSSLEKNNYHPKTQEPGEDFEKVIGLHEKEEAKKPPLGTQRVVNLKEQKIQAERNAPPIKNVVNIKEMSGVSSSQRQQYVGVIPKIIDNKEEIQKNYALERQATAQNSKKIETNKKSGYSIIDKINEMESQGSLNIPQYPTPQYPTRKIDFSKKPGVETKAEPEKNLMSQSNSINHTYKETVRNETWNNTHPSSMDETEKKLFQKSNSGEDAQIQNSFGNIPGYDPGAGIKFTSSQKLPFEKLKEKESEIVKKEEKPTSPPSSPQPYRIFPSNFEDR